MEDAFGPSLLEAPQEMRFMSNSVVEMISYIEAVAVATIYAASAAVIREHTPECSPKFCERPRWKAVTTHTQLV